jgi:hypothetical protein
MAIERDQSGLSDRTEIIDQYMICRLFDEDWALPLAVEGLLGSVRTIPMSPAPQYGYDPIPLIRAGAKTHTVRGGARILGTINQVAVGGVRIPLWIRWTARERTTFGEIWNDEFAWCDGIRPEPPLDAMTAMQRLVREFHGTSPRVDQPMWVMHFAIFADLMDELQGRWEL